MDKYIEIRGVKIGEGVPKICVPIVGRTKTEIVEAAKSFESIRIDVVEWRADWFEDVFDFSKVEEVLIELRQTLGNTPLLFTFRTLKEGGEKAIEPTDYVRLNRKVAQTGLVDLIDVEAFTKAEKSTESVEERISEATYAKELIHIVQELGIAVVASNHDFAKTPSKDEIIRRLCKMQELGADIPKIAVMPQTKKDVLTLLSATEEMRSRYADRPIITMSMGGAGAISRLCGEVFGSALTFGAAGKASAPGQMEVRDLHLALSLVHKGICGE